MVAGDSSQTNVKVWMGRRGEGRGGGGAYIRKDVFLQIFDLAVDLCQGQLIGGKFGVFAALHGRWLWFVSFV